MSENATETVEAAAAPPAKEPAVEQETVTAAAESTEAAAASEIPALVAASEAATTKTPVENIPEPSSGTDDDEPSAQPAGTPTLERGEQQQQQQEEAKTEEPQQDQEATTEETKQMTADQARAAFVNEGLIRWETARNAWLGNRDGSDDDSSSAKPTAVPLDVDKIIDVLFYSSSREARAGNVKPEQFPRNVPLPQMVDILQDLWEAEGLDA